MHRRLDLLDGLWTQRKAATYTQDNTNTEKSHINIHAPWSVIRTLDLSV
jgi:hypothetical protein